MTVISKLAVSLGRRDEVPNQELAREVVRNKDRTAIRELVENLGNKDKNIQSDCIKVLYEIGEQQPDLIADYDQAFISLLSSKNNRLVWGAMTALDCIASVNPAGIFESLDVILVTADNGSVITKDHGVSILIKLAADKRFLETSLTLLLEILNTCSTNQLPMYAENSVKVIFGIYKPAFVKVYSDRLKEIEKESKQKRLEKVIKKLTK